MRLILPSLICGLLSASAILAGDGAGSRAQSGAAPSAQVKAVLPAPAGPVFLEFQVRLDGRPLPAVALSVHTEAGGEVDAILFEQLDVNKDGVLTSDELRRARSSLAPLDADDDETISKAELLAASRKRTAGAEAAKPSADASPAQRQSPKLLLNFELFDRKHGSPHVSVVSAKDSPPFQWRQLSAESGELNVNGLKVALAAKRTHASSGDRSAFYKLRFAVVDQDKNNYLDRAEFAALGLSGAEFRDVDANGDGQIVRGELTDYLSKKASSSTGHNVVIAIADESPSLFDYLDTRSDGRLSPRELNTAADRLRNLDRNHDGRLTLGEIRTQARIEVGVKRPDTDRAVRAMAGRQRQMELPTPDDRGPKWFRKMDRNYDGDVSWREFLGPRAVFDQLDTDHDGLLSPEEAEHAR